MTEKNSKRNYLIVALPLLLGGIGLTLISRKMGEPEKDILSTIGLVLLLAFLLQRILFYCKPGLFNDKPTHPD